MSLQYRVKCDGELLMDPAYPGLSLVSAELTREINDGMFDGQFRFSMLLTHPMFDRIHEMRSTVTVDEISDDGETELFRGRPISIEDRFDGTREINCESDIKYLMDIPDVFSKLEPDNVVYRVGTETKWRTETMRTIPKGDVVPKIGGGECEISRFGENQNYKGKRIYRSDALDTDGLETRAVVNYSDNGNSRWLNYVFMPEDVERIFTVEWWDDSGQIRIYELPMLTAAYTTTLYSGTGLLFDYNRNRRDNVPGIIRYLGNIGMIAADNNVYDISGFDPDLKVHIKSGTDGAVTGEVKISDLNFCIVYYSSVSHWEITYLTRNPMCFWSTAGETIVYAISEVSSELKAVRLKVYNNSATSVLAMANAILCRDDANPLTGYNAIADESKRIFLGKTEFDGDVSLSSIDSCYASMRKWLEETGGYCKIRKTDGRYYLDLLADSGEISDDFRVTLGMNLKDAKISRSCENLITGVYVKGVKKETEEQSNGGTSSGSSGSSNIDTRFKLLLTDFYNNNYLDAPTAQDMLDINRIYCYTGPGEHYYPYSPDGRHSGLYQYIDGKWKEIWETTRVYEQALSPQAMINRRKLYQYAQRKALHYETGKVYAYQHGLWTPIETIPIPTASEDCTIDIKRGIVWNEKAKEIYGAIVGYLEVDVTDIEENQRYQYMVSKGQDEIKSKLTAFESFDISLVDPRLVGAKSKTPILGNYYPIDWPWLGITDDYKRLSSIKTDLLNQYNGQLTLGGKRPELSDYVAKKGERM